MNVSRIEDGLCQERLNIHQQYLSGISALKGPRVAAFIAWGGAGPTFSCSGPVWRSDYVAMLVLDGTGAWKYPAANYFCDNAIPLPEATFQREVW